MKAKNTHKDINQWAKNLVDLATGERDRDLPSKPADPKSAKTPNPTVKK